MFSQTFDKAAMISDPYMIIVAKRSHDKDIICVTLQKMWKISQICLVCFVYFRQMNNTENMSVGRWRESVTMAEEKHIKKGNYI